LARWQGEFSVAFRFIAGLRGGFVAGAATKDKLTSKAVLTGRKAKK